METKACVLRIHRTTNKFNGQNKFGAPEISQLSNWWIDKLLKFDAFLVKPVGKVIENYMEERNRVKTEEELRARSKAFKEELIASFMFK